MQTVFVMHNCQTSLTAKRNTDVLHRSHGRATHVSSGIASICYHCLLQQSEWIAMLTFSDLSASIEALRIQQSQQPVSALKWKYVSEQSQLMVCPQYCRTAYCKSAPCLHCRRSLSLLPDVSLSCTASRCRLCKSDMARQRRRRFARNIPASRPSARIGMVHPYSCNL